MTITPTPGKLLTDVQIIKVFLLFKYRNSFDFYSGTFGNDSTYSEIQAIEKL
jgi:hypothetical protein